MGRWIFLFCLLSVNFAQAVEFTTDLHITTKDGTKLAANLFYHADQQKRPAIIFINSWVLGEHEYFVKARDLAKSGYNVLSYAARGWGSSEGLVDVASPDDVQDLSAAVDYLIQSTNTDPQRIGAAGISYGAGISLLATAFEPRIRAVAAMSGWADLAASLYPGSTTNALWTKLLLYVGLPTGHLSDNVKNYVAQLNRYENIDEIMAWAKIRSASTYIDKTNQNQPAILILSSWNDSLFNPNATIQYFKNLNTPKKMILQEGVHGLTEGGSLIRLDISQSWKHVSTWFDQYLKAQTPPEKSVPQVEMQIRGSSRFEVVSGDDLKRVVPDQTYGLGFPDRSANETLIPESKWPQDHKNFPVFAKINIDRDSIASTGLAVIGAFLDSYLKIPVVINWYFLNTQNSFSFRTTRLENTLKLRGVSSVNIHVKSSSPQQTVVAYLYSINPFGFAQLITHGVATFGNTSVTDFEKVKVSFYATAYNIPAGNRVGLVIDTQDEIYAERQQGEGQMQLFFSESQPNVLNLKTNL